MASQIHTLDSFSNDESNFFQDLGKTYDSAFLERRRIILMGNQRNESARPSDIRDKFTYTFVSNQIDFSDEIFASASGRATFGIGRLRANASLNKFFSINNYACYIFGYMRLIRSRVALDLNEIAINPFSAFVGVSAKRRTAVPPLLVFPLNEKLPLLVLRRWLRAWPTNNRERGDTRPLLQRFPLISRWYAHSQ